MDLVQVLRRAQDLGFVGPGDVEDHITHASRFLSSLGIPGRAMDLGSGGGLPGLVLAAERPSTKWFFLDAGQRRCAFLREAVDQLGFQHVSILEGRAEELARHADLRHSFDLVVARSFGRPAITAECATGFLREGGQLIVSEPPGLHNRWDEAGLRQLGMSVSHVDEVAVIRQDTACDDNWPRRTGVPAKRPLF